MSDLRNSDKLDAATRQETTAAKERHGVQARISPQNAIISELRAGEKEAVNTFPCMHLCESRQVGVLRAPSPYGKAYSNVDEIVKHLSVVYLYTVLKAPTKWTPETFTEMVQLESTIAATVLETTLRIRRNDKTYHIHLSSTMLKGRFGVGQKKSAKQVRLNVHQALARIRRGKAAIWKCDSNFFLIRRVAAGWYFYTTSLLDRPALMFFSCPRLMVNFVLMMYGCTERSKYVFSNVVLHSVEVGDVVRIVWKMKRSVGMKLVSSTEALLYGNVCLVLPSLERSLELCLNVVDRAGIAEAKLRSWDNRTLNGCFSRQPSSEMAAEKIATFMRDQKASTFTLGPYHITCRTTPVGHRQRKHFEEVVNYFLASCTALLVVGLDCCFLLWSRAHFIYWFSPYRYSSLQEKPEVVQNRACFVHITNALAKASQSLYEYLFELGVFPDHSIELYALRVDEGRSPNDAIFSEDDEDSLDDEGLTIPPASEKGWRSFYRSSLHSSSELRLARQMLDMVYRAAEDRCI